MNNHQITPIAVEHALEMIRQQRETFNQHKIHEARWFALRLAMGYSAIVLLGSVMVVASYILLSPAKFPVSVVSAAGAALFVDVLGLLAGVWRIALNPKFPTRLTPVTKVDIPNLLSIDDAADLPTESQVQAANQGLHRTAEAAGEAP